MTTNPVAEYGVVTAVHPSDLAVAPDLYVEIESPSPSNDFEGKYQTVVETYGVMTMTMLSLRQPVWQLGEILLLDYRGREILFPGRKPDKWRCTVETFDLIDDAVARAIEVTEAARG